MFLAKIVLAASLVVAPFLSVESQPAVAAQAGREDWHLLRRGTVAAAYVDANSISRSGDYVEAWTWALFFPPHRAGAIVQMKTKMGVECGRLLVHEVEGTILYQGQNQPAPDQFPDRVFRPVTPTNHQDLARFICGDRSGSLGRVANPASDYLSQRGR